MLRPKLLYFLYYAAAAALLPFLVLYYEHLGLSGRQVGVLSALLPLMTLLGVPVWSTAADTLQRHKVFIVITVGGALAFTLPPLLTTNYLTLLALVGVLSLFTAPIMPLVDHLTLTLLPEKSRYGALRLWGAVGWGLAAPLTGLLTEQGGLRWAFFVAFGLLGLLWGVSFTLPEVAAERKSEVVRGIRQFVSPAWLSFLLAAFTGGVGLAVSSSFLYLHMADLGVSGTLVGLALTVATVSELPVFWFSGSLLRRYAAPTLLAVALFTFALRLLLYAFLLEPLLLVTVQLLHGPTFSLLWVAGVAYADALAPTGLGATAQGLFTATVLGLGGAVGALVGGVLYDAVGAAGMFQWTAVGTLAVGAYLTVTLYNRHVAKKELH